MQYKEALDHVEIGLGLWDRSEVETDKDIYMICYLKVVNVLKKITNEKSLAQTMTMAICDDSAVRSEAEVILDWLVNSGHTNVHITEH